MVTSVTKGGTQKLPKKVRLSKTTDVTIRWKALEVPLVFRFNDFRVENVYSEFFSQKLSPFKKSERVNDQEGRIDAAE
jgi:hypothetical protein